MTTENDTNGYDKNNEKVRANGAWITNEFLQKLISRREGDEDIKVTNSDVCAAVGVGDNYLSILYRTTVEFTRKDGKSEKRQLMIKGAPTAKFLKEMIETMGIFTKELAMYNKILPAMKALTAEHMPDETDFIAAESYQCDLPNTIVMEDLQILGYKMAVRRNQLDFDHCVATIKSLARFHALSVRVQETHPDAIKEVSVEFYQEQNRPSMAPYLEKCFPIWVEKTREFDGLARFGPIFKRLGKNPYDKMMEMVQMEGKLPVLNHGDSWINNVLFRYDEEGKVAHARLVDYQLSRLGSPALDLIYFMFTSPQPGIVTERMFELVKIYHDALTSDLKSLGLETDRLTLEDLHEELRARIYFSLIVMITVTPIIIAKPSDAMDLENFDPDNIPEDHDFPLNNNYKDEHYRRVVAKYLDHLDKIGYLNYAEDTMRHVDERIAAMAANKVEQTPEAAELKPGLVPEIAANSS